MADPRNGGPVRGISKPTFIVCGNETQSTYRKPVLSNIAAFKSVKLVTLDYPTHVTLFNTILKISHTVVHCGRLHDMHFERELNLIRLAFGVLRECAI